MSKALGYPVESTSAKSNLPHDQPPSPGIPGDTCPACGGTETCVLFAATDRLYATTGKLFQIVECKRCRFIRLYPQPTPRELRDYYPADYWIEPEDTVTDRLDMFYRRLVLRDHLRFAERVLRESEEEGIVLDVGCGSGVFLKMLAERGGKVERGDKAERGRRNVVGLDFALDAARAAWKHSGVPAICGTLSKAPFAPGTCAAITMFHVIEHLYDPASYLYAAGELLAPGGRLIVQVPNAACWQFLLFGDRWNGLEVPRHLVHFRLKDLETLLDNCPAL
jgi:SAM-dependent methyltransferase